MKTLSLSEQARADALADAETLLRVADEMSWNDDEAYGVLTLLWEAEIEQFPQVPKDTQYEQVRYQRSREWTPRECARAAFRAVPGLRGE